MTKRSKQLPKNAILKALRQLGLEAKRVTVPSKQISGRPTRTWEIKNTKNGAVVYIPTIDLIYETFFSESAQKERTLRKNIANQSEQPKESEQQHESSI